MKSTNGRPRRATDAQIEAVLAWHANYLAWLAQRPEIPTKEALAKHLNLHPSLVHRIILRKGEFKQVSPEDRVAEEARRRARLRELG